MNITNKFNFFLALYFFSNALFLFLTEARPQHWGGLLFFILIGPIINTLISLIIKLNYKTYSWYFFTGTLISMAILFLVNTIMFLNVASGA